MKRLILTTTAAILLISCEHRIIEVKDGDTVVISDFPTNTIVRLAEIDCPEKSQAYGAQAARFTSQYLGEKVRFEPIAKDRYDRTIAKVYTRYGYLSEQLVKNGYAWVYRKYTNNEGLIRLEAEARKNKVGLWHTVAINPYQYRLTH